MTLTKADLTQRIADTVGLNRRESAEMVEAFFEEVVRSLAAGRDVKLSGFGNFSVKNKAARPGRNPKTGVEATIAARRVVTFRPSQKLRFAVETALTSPEVQPDNTHQAAQGNRAQVLRVREPA